MNVLCIVLVAVALHLGLLSRPSFAEDSEASYTCDTKNNTLVIRYTPDIDIQHVNSPSHATTRLVRFMSLLVLDKEGGR